MLDHHVPFNRWHNHRRKSLRYLPITLVRKGFLFAKQKKLVLRLEWLQFGHLFTCTGNCKKSVDSLLRKGPEGDSSSLKERVYCRSCSEAFRTVIFTSTNFLFGGGYLTWSAPNSKIKLKENWKHFYLRLDCLSSPNLGSPSNGLTFFVSRPSTRAVKIHQ